MWVIISSQGWIHLPTKGSSWRGVSTIGLGVSISIGGWSRGWGMSGCRPVQPTPAFSSCPQLRLSPTLFSSYDPYDDMIFMFMTHARDYRHPTTITTLCLVFLATPWKVPFGRSSLGGGRSSSIRSGSFSLPFVFGLGDVPRRTRLPLEISAYSRLSACDFYGLFKSFIPLIQPSLCSNSHTHDLTIYESHDTRTTRQ